MMGARLPWYFASIISLVASQRTTYNFDFGWRFHLGNVKQSSDALCPASVWTTNLQGFYCEGWAHQAAYQLQEEECRLYCCGDPQCAGYSYSSNWCLIGADVSSCVHDPTGQGKGWTGGARAVPHPIAQPPADGPQSASFDDSTWDLLDVPHDFIVATAPSAQAERSHGYRFKNVSWYRKTFSVPKTANKGSKLYLEFDGVFRSSDMWLNGKFLGHHSSGYTTFRYRIDNAPAFDPTGANTVAVRVDPRGNEGWWYEGGGIYRHTRLVAVSPLAHVAQWGVYAPSEVIGPVTTVQDGGAAVRYQADAEVKVYTEVTAPPSSSFRVRSSLVSQSDPSRVLWTDTSATMEGPTTVFQQTGVLKDLGLWDVDSPQLHTLITHVLGAGGAVTDSVNTTIGARKVHLDVDAGLFLNGRSIKVKGMCNHQDFAGVGTAVPDSVSEYRVKQLKHLGANAWRMSHNPPNPELLDATDSLGFMVWDENRMFGNFTTWYSDMADMIKRDRNHPSIIWWSLCNEFGCQQRSDNVTLAAGVRFREIIKELDDTRPISGAWSGGSPLTPLAGRWGEEVCDMMGINYAYTSLAKYHEMHPGTALISSESCSCTSDRTYLINDTHALIGASHAWACIRECWSPIVNDSFVQGSFDWTGFDYRGEETPSNWPAINSHFGILDLAGFMKDDAFYYKAMYNLDEPLAHITPPNWQYPHHSPRAHGSMGVAHCAPHHASMQQWTFNLTAAVDHQGPGSLLESKLKPGQCLVFQGAGEQSYPSNTSDCSSTDRAQRFHYDTASHHVLHTDAGGTHCLDANGNEEGTVGFYGCKHSANGSYPFYDNQAFVYDSTLGTFTQPTTTNPVCLTYVDASLVQVWVYTNGDEVELFLNGESLGATPVAAFDKGTFAVAYAEGNLTAVTRKGGRVWATDTVITPGAPSVVRLDLEPLMRKGLRADGQDAVLLTARVEDAHGHVQHHSSGVDQPVVTFTVKGPGRLIGVGSGDPSDHSSDKADHRRAFNGLVRAVVQATKVPGKISITASSEGLQSSTVEVMAEAVAVMEV